MRGTGWLPFAVASALWLLAVAGPVAAIATVFASDPAEAAGPRPAFSMAATALRTGAWAVGVAIAATAAGLLPGRALGRRLGSRGGTLLAVLYLAPVCLPAYLIYHAWGLLWSPGTALFTWSVEHDAAALLRSISLALGLVAWCWPIVAWCVAGAVASQGGAEDELLRIDGAGRVRRTLAEARRLAPALALGGAVVFLVVFNNTVLFDFAQVKTLGYELRALDSLGGSPREVLFAAWPGLALALAGAILLARLLRHEKGSADDAPRPTARSRGDLVAVLLVWGLAVGVPAFLLIRSIDDPTMIDRVLRAHGESLARDVVASALTGLLGAAIAFGVGAAWLDRRPGIRRLALLQTGGWILLAIVPGTVAAVSFEAAYNREPFRDALYLSAAVIVLGRLARYGVIGALLGRWVAADEGRTSNDLRRIDGADTLPGLWRAMRPRWVAATLASGFVVAVLALSELPVTARLQPPGYDPIAQALLDGMHYQRLEVVSVVSLLFLGLALPGVLLVFLFLRPRSPRRPAAALLALGIVLVAPGCGDDGPAALAPTAAGASHPDVRFVYGGGGRTAGFFNYPRAIASDPRRDLVYVVDKTARVQRFGPDGTFQLAWLMPEFDKGMPVGISVHPDGRVFVADTHEHRVAVFDPEGTLLATFGTYGDGPGQFRFPTDVAFAPDGSIYVAEYGGHDRIQVFGPDFEYRFEFGSFGHEPGRFNRPQSIAFAPDGSELFVADAINHRVDVFTPRGEFLRSFGEPGNDPGRLRYPYGIEVWPDGTLAVTEFGNNRVQFFDASGRVLGEFGGPGSTLGRLYSPWAAARLGDELHVLDSRNNRVQVIVPPTGSDSDHAG